MNSIQPVAAALFSLVLIVSVPGYAETALPKAKQTSLGLYLTAEEAYELRTSDPNSLLIDIRSLAEITFLGMPTIADAHIEYRRMDQNSVYDAKKASFTLSPNPHFLMEIEGLLAQRGLAKDTPVILMCRSGSRSARAADELTARGFTQVYSVTDGYEGDKMRNGALAGQRIINGWKNAGLPWSYKLELSKLHDLPSGVHP